jgi:hypothetical protein
MAERKPEWPGTGNFAIANINKLADFEAYVFGREK